MSLAVIFLLVGCGSGAAKASGSLSFKDDSGTVIKLKGPVHRIVSLGPSDTEIVLALGLLKDLVGADKDSFLYLPSPYDHELRGVADVGSSVTSVNIEKIEALKPGLVLAVYNAPYVSKLRSLGFHVAVLDPATIAQIETDVQTVGEAAGDARGARRLVVSMKAKIQAIAKAAAATKSRPKVFVELDPTLYTAGPGSFIDALVTLAHGQNVADGMAKTAYPQVSSEQVIAADPDVIILQDQAFGGSPENVRARPGWASIQAVKRGRIVVSVNPDLLSNPGPAVVRGLWELAEAIHPGLHLPRKDR